LLASPSATAAAVSLCGISSFFSGGLWFFNFLVAVEVVVVVFVIIGFFATEDKFRTPLPAAEETAAGADFVLEVATGAEGTGAGAVTVAGAVRGGGQQLL
jgi:hypothetical protein